MTSPASPDPPRWVRALQAPVERVLGRGDGGGASGTGPGGFRLNRVIDWHKVLTGPFVAVLMLAFDVATPAAWTYLALHGSYGVAWVIKDLTYGDARWRRRVGPGAAVAVWGFLTLYWVAPAILVLGQAGVIEPAAWQPGDWWPAGPAQRGVAIFLYAIGLVLMIGADVQKNVALKAGVAPDGAGGRGPSAARGGGGAAGGSAVEDPSGPGLITTGFYNRIRHPNYLGEMLIYGGFALVVGHLVPWLILAAVWLFFFYPSMAAIEASLARYPEFEAWRRRTGFLLPRARGRRRED